MTKVKADTVIRTAVLILALVNQIFYTTGRSVLPISNAQLSEIITLVFTIAASIAAWWKNNSFSSAAIRGDELMNAMKHKDTKY